MNADEAKNIAESFIATQNMRDFKATFAEAHKSVTSPNTWTVNFDLRSPMGGLIDGGVMVMVDESTGKARFFESL